MPVSKIESFLSNLPGGLMVWILLWAEIAAFSLALIYMFIVESGNSEPFIHGRKLLDQKLATYNTLLLLFSGFLMARANHLYHHSNKSTLESRPDKVLLLLGGAALGGVLFLVLKGVEYQDKLAQGYALGYNVFFDFYWLLTLFHAFHLLLGILIIGAMGWKVVTNRPFENDDFGFTTGATYWHMCDLIWILIFPVIYML